MTVDNQKDVYLKSKLARWKEIHIVIHRSLIDSRFCHVNCKCRELIDALHTSCYVLQ